MARPKADTRQVTFRIPNDWWKEAETLSKTVGYDASPTDALREAIRRGFDAMAKDGAPVRVSAWDGVRSRCLFWIGDDLKAAVAEAKSLAAAHAGGRWTCFRVYRNDQEEPVHVEHVKKSKR